MPPQFNHKWNEKKTFDKWNYINIHHIYGLPQICQSVRRFFYQRNSANVWLAPVIQDRGISIEMALSIHLDDVLAVGRVDRTTIFYIIFVFLHYSHRYLHRHHCFSRTCVCVMHFSKSNAISATEPFFPTRYIYIGLLFQFNRHIKWSVCVVYIPYNLHG